MLNQQKNHNSNNHYRKEYLLKDGQQLIMRTPDLEDAEALVDLMKTLDSETKFLAREPDEFSFTVEQEREFIKNNTTNENSCFLIVELSGRIVGNCSTGRILNNKRYIHRAGMGLAVLKAYWGKGIGKIMMQECISWCKNNGIEQLELEVVTDNHAAISLYKSFGFEVCGTKKHALKYSDGTYADEFNMVLFLS